MTRNAIRKRELRAERKALKLCTECGKEPNEIGLFMCMKCALKRNKYERNRRKKNVENGKCECGRDRIPNNTRCYRCNENHKKYIKNLTLKRKENNCCTRCGKPLLERTDVTKCTNCSEHIFDFKWI